MTPGTRRRIPDPDRLVPFPNASHAVGAPGRRRNDFGSTGGAVMLAHFFPLTVSSLTFRAADDATRME